MHHRRTDQHWHERKRGPAHLPAEQQQETTDYFEQKNRVSRPTRKTVLREECRRARQGEKEVLRSSVREHHQSKRNAKKSGTEAKGRMRGVIHGNGCVRTVPEKIGAA